MFVKGEEAKQEGYYLVIDTVEPEDSKERTWRHPWQLGLNAPNIAIRTEDQSATAITESAALQTLPVAPPGNLELTVIQGQEQPQLLGWRVHDKTALPWPVSTYAWQAVGTFSRAWVIQMQGGESQWPVASVEILPGDQPGELRFLVNRKDGGKDQVMRRFPGEAEVVFNGEPIRGDLAILSCDEEGSVRFKLELDGGLESVAKRR